MSYFQTETKKQKMAKGGSSGGKAGCGYASGKGAGYSAGKSAGKAGAGSPLYAGRGMGTGKTPLPGSKHFSGKGYGRNGYQKGYRIGTDGASLLDGYNLGKEAMEKLIGNYMKAAQGASANDALKAGHGAYSSDLADASQRDMLRYRAQEPSEDSKPCMKCGAPAAKGAPLCLKCMTERAGSYSN